LLFVLIGASIGYAGAIVHTKRTEAKAAVTDLWYFYEVLSSMEKGRSDSARAAIAHKADQALGIVSESDYLLLGAEYHEFKSKVLKRYRGFREANQDLYKFPSAMPQDKESEWTRTDRGLADYLKKY
jgi:hypothetical protein